MRWLISGVAGAACAAGVAAGDAASVEVVCAQTAVVLAQKRHNPSRATVTRENRFMMARPLSPRSLAPLRESVRFRVSEANFSDARAECLTHISHSGYRKMPSNNVYRGHKESLSVRSSILSFHWLRSGESAPLRTSTMRGLPPPRNSPPDPHQKQARSGVFLSRKIYFRPLAQTRALS